MNNENLKYNPCILGLYRERLPGLRKDGQNYSTTCPFHGDKKPSFKIWMIPAKRNTWKCFGGCSESGDIYDLLQKMDGITYPQSVKLVQDYVDKHGKSWSRDQDQVDEVFKTIGEEEKEFRKYRLADYIKRAEDSMRQNPAGYQWLADIRGITPETARRFNLGYIQNIPTCKENWADKGWIVFPYVDDDDVVLLKYRSIVEKDFRREPGMKTTLYNLPAIDAFEPLFVVEGEIDALTMEQAGFHAVSLPAATNPKHTTVVSPEMKDRIMQAGSVILAGDNDPTGLGTMDRLYAELSDGKTVFKLAWPPGIKDANQAFLDHCHGNVQEFKNLIESLTAQARVTIMPNIYDLQATMLAPKGANLSDDPERMRFPWPKVDQMVIIRPTDVLGVFGTQTKVGKTTWIMNLTIDEARRGSIILNYQCELSKDAFACITASHLLQRNRNSLHPDDYKDAALLLRGVKYYIGRNPTLSRVGQVLDLIEAAIKRLSPRIVVLDHLHYICRNERDDVKAQADAMQRIKRMAVQYGLIFIVVGQPRKATQENRGKAVHITDAKGSESYGSDSDAIFALHRDWIKTVDPNNPPKDDYAPETDVRLLGARFKGDGPTVARLYYNGSTATFREISYASPENGNDD